MLFKTPIAALLCGLLATPVAAEQVSTAPSAGGGHPEVLLLPAQAAGPGRYEETIRSDLTSRVTDTGYRPDPSQGAFHTTPSGTGWWGAGPTEGAPRPVVFLLHGSGRTGQSMVDMWYETAEREGLVLVAPDFEGTPGWDRGVPDLLIAQAALVQASGLYSIDPGQVFLFGHSRGGIAAQVWANRAPGPWRGLVVHAGTLPAQAVAPAPGPVPIRHYVGTRDDLFPVDAARASGRAMAAQGHPFDLVLLEGHSHWFYQRGEDIAADAWGWMANLPD